MRFNRFGIFLFLFVVIGLCALFVLKSQRGEQKKRKTNRMSDEQRAQLLQWEQLPAPPPGVQGRKPYTPVFPPWSFPLEFGQPVEDTSSDGIQLWERLYAVLAACPLPEIKNDFLSRLRDGRIAKNFSIEHAGNIATLRLVEARDLEPESRKGLSDDAIVPKFTLHPYRVYLTEAPDDIIALWVTVRHEYEHFLQLEKASAEKRRMLASKTAEVYATREHCSSVWKDEFDAYSEQCRHALAWDNITERWNQSCVYFSDEKAFKQQVFLLMIMNTGLMPCFPVFAELAGHPHPEAFR